MNQYDQAVKLIEDYLEATQPLQINFPGMETSLQFAIKILKDNSPNGDLVLQ